MYYTQEQIKEIAEGLSAYYAKKDTQLPAGITPNGNEIITFVQNGDNVQFLVGALFNEYLQDYVINGVNDIPIVISTNDSLSLSSNDDINISNSHASINLGDDSDISISGGTLLFNNKEVLTEDKALLIGTLEW